jgi:hypothetical protein
VSSGIQCFDAGGNKTFDSTTDNVLFSLEERVIQPAEINRQGTVTFSYPAYAGMKLNAFLTVYNNGGVDVWAVPSCRVTYPGGIPTVSIWVDNKRDDIPICTTMLSVFYTGASQ